MLVKMLTRSQKRKLEEQNICERVYEIEEMQPKYNFEFDFDEASRYWLENKIKIGNGCYKYIEKKHKKLNRK